MNIRFGAEIRLPKTFQMTEGDEAGRIADRVIKFPLENYPLPQAVLQNAITPDIVVTVNRDLASISPSREKDEKLSNVQQFEGRWDDTYQVDIYAKGHEQDPACHNGFKTSLAEVDDPMFTSAKLIPTPSFTEEVAIRALNLQAKLVGLVKAVNP